MRASFSSTSPTAARFWTGWRPRCGRVAGSSSRIMTGVAFGFDDDEEGFSDVTEAILQFMERGRVRARVRPSGRRRYREPRVLTEVRGEGRVRIVDSNSPGFDFFRLTFESLRGAVVDSGLLSAEDAEAASARFGEEPARVHTADDGRYRPPRLLTAIRRSPGRPRPSRGSAIRGLLATPARSASPRR